MRTRYRSASLLALFLAACGGRGSSPSPSTDLSAMVVSAGTLSPAFSPDVLAYSTMVASSVASVTITPTAADPAAQVTINGQPVASGAPSTLLALLEGPNIVVIGVTNVLRTTPKTYTVTITRSPDPLLSGLTLSVGVLSPEFNPQVTTYSATVGFTVQQLTVTPSTAFSGGGVTVNGASVPPGQPSAAIALNEGRNDISVRVSTDEGESRGYSIVVTRESAARFAQEAYVKASNTEKSDFFGQGIAISGDTLAVGANLEASRATGVNGDENDNSLSNSGAVYVFVRSGTTWIQQAYIKASRPRQGEFGYRVALSGDTLAVGAWRDRSRARGVNGDQNDNGAVDSGAVYVFVRSGTTWSQQAYIKASNTDAGDWFSFSIALGGDTLAVGAIHEDSNARGVNGDENSNSAASSGAVYVFTRSGITWSQQAYIKASNSDAEDWFGGSVALSGDTLAVGAVREDSDARGIDGDQNNKSSQTGAVYVFTRSGITWSQQAYIKASNADSGDEFGESVALIGDTLAVGANLEDSRAKGVNGDESDNDAGASGAAYVFTRSGTTWSQQAYLKASNTDRGDYFGGAVALSGDTVVVGASNEASKSQGVDGDEIDNSAAGSGAAYVFTRRGTTWSQLHYLKASNAEADDRFGHWIAVSGDTCVVSARYEDGDARGVNGPDNNKAPTSGAVYVFR